MVATVDAPERPAVCHEAAGHLLMRVSSPSRRGQLVRLGAAKCTIGSGRQCTLRLRSPGVAPMHCLVLRGSRATIVRRWSADTRLNEQAFTDAELSKGDRLAIGPVELEIVDLGTPSIASDRSEPNDSANWQPSDAEDANAAARRQWQVERDETQRELDEQRDQLADQSIELQSLRRAISEDRTAVERQQTAWLQEKQEAEQEISRQRQDIERQRAELDVQAAKLDGSCNALTVDRQALQREQDAFAERQRQWEAEKGRLQSELDQGRQELAAESARQAEQSETLAAQQANIENARNAASEEQRQWQTERDAQAERQDSLQSENNVLADERRQWRAEKDEMQRRLDQQRIQATTELTKLQAQRDIIDEERRALVEQRAAFEQERQAWELERQQAAEAAAAPVDATATPEPQELQFLAPSEKPPVSLADVFRRVGATVDTSDEPSEPEPIRAKDTAIAAVRPAERSPSAANAHDDDGEESVDAYMSRLMQRVRSSENSGEPASSVSEPAPAPAEPPIQVSQRREPVTVLPRAAAPETHVDLSAMRKLANLSAQNNLRRHARRVLVSEMYSRLVASVIALVTGVGLFIIWKRFAAWEAAYYASLVALLVAIYTGLRYAMVTGRLIVNKSGHVDWNSEQEAMPASAEDTAATRESQAADTSLAEEAANDVADGAPGPRSLEEEGA
ncbi:MAG: FHA domain-containing protein [Thermoguttaceae bacterium]